MFNVRIKTFYDTEQIQIFSHVQHSKGEIVRRHIDPETGEISPLEKGRLMYNPFTDEVERMTELIERKEAEDYARKSCARTINKIYDIARSDVWDWFTTFTFNPERVNSFDYAECTQKLSDWLANMRRESPDMKYIVVPEQHKSGRWHFHGLIRDCEGLQFTFSGHRDKKGRRIYNLSKYRFGFTTATRITDHRRASSYLCKYITKDLCELTKHKKRYWCSQNINRPKVSEFLVDGDLLDLAVLALSQDDAHIKSIKTPWTSVTYIDQSIPQTHESL